MTNANDRPTGLTTSQRLLLASGALSTLLYIAMNVFVPLQWESYDSVSQTISELSAIGAPTRALWIPFGALYTVLVTAFGWGVWTTARGNRPLRVVGALMLVYGLSGFAWFFAPMHLRGNPATLTDVMHLVLGGATGLLYMIALGFGAAALGRRFRLYTLATMAVLVFTAILMGLESPGVGRNLPTPLLGVWERISIGSAMLWMAVLSVVLLRARRRSAYGGNAMSCANPPSANVRRTDSVAASITETPSSRRVRYSVAPSGDTTPAQGFVNGTLRSTAPVAPFIFTSVAGPLQPQSAPQYPAYTADPSGDIASPNVGLPNRRSESCP